MSMRKAIRLRTLDHMATAAVKRKRRSESARKRECQPKKGQLALSLLVEYLANASENLAMRQSPPPPSGRAVCVSRRNATHFRASTLSRLPVAGSRRVDRARGLEGNGEGSVWPRPNFLATSRPQFLAAPHTGPLSPHLLSTTSSGTEPRLPSKRAKSASEIARQANVWRHKSAGHGA
jgi:hypothetical protein